MGFIVLEIHAIECDKCGHRAAPAFSQEQAFVNARGEKFINTVDGFFCKHCQIDLWRKTKERKEYEHLVLAKFARKA